MKILVDKQILGIHKLFGHNSSIQLCNGRMISSKYLKDIDILIVRSVTNVNKKLLDNSNSIKFVATVTSGSDHIDQNYLKRRGVYFTSTVGSNAISVVEYVLASLFWIAQRDNFFLKDKTIGIVGVGHIGSLLYQRLCNFGMRVLLCDPLRSEKLMIDKSLWRSLENLVSEVDILTLHTPLIYHGQYPTWHMINLDVLEALSNYSILINTSRGSVVDNCALLKILKSGKKLKVILDVWEAEPNISLSLLSCIDIGTPHIAGHTVASKVRGIMHIYHKYCDYFNIDNLDRRKLFFSKEKKNNFVKIKSKVDECLIYRLINVIMYNIYNDNLMLRYAVHIPGGFDKIRDNYCYHVYRRDWSSIFLQVYSDCDAEILMGLGFNVY